MKRLRYATLACAMILLSCTTVPLTGRRQLSLIPNGNMLSMSYTEYDSFLKEHKISDDAQKTAMVRRVGARTQQAVEQYFRANNMAEVLQDYAWEFNLVEDEAVNAWCMPGGKVVVYTGILPVAQGDAGLAVVMGHEIAHAVAKHGNERMSQVLLGQLGGAALSVAMKEQPEQTKQLWMGVYGAGAQYGVLLPYGRTHEYEADRLGLTFMAMAGYDPNEAIAFWQRMAAQKKGASPPEFLSTHPAGANRIRAMQSHMPEAMKHYRAATP